MHEKIRDIIKTLNIKLTGHYRYYGISGNIESLRGFYEYIKSALFKALKRRSQKSILTWERYARILERWPIAIPKVYVNIWS